MRSVVSLSFIFPHPPEDILKKNKMGVLISCIAVVLRALTLASPQRPDGARCVFTDQADTARLKREAP